MKNFPVVFGQMRVAVVLGLLALPSFAQPPTPRLIATQPSLSLSPDYVGIGIQSRCGDDWIFLYTAEWACLTRQGDRLALNSSGAYSGSPSTALWQRLVRGPTATDNKVYMAIYNFAFGPVVAIDPVTGASNAVGYISNPPLEPVVHADRDGDGHLELVSVGFSSSSLIALPGGPQTPFQVLASTDVKVVLSGQLDGDSQSELGWLTPDGSLRFRDAATLLDESWTPHITFSDYRPAWTGDWDGDGHDELALTTTFPGSLALLDPDLPTYNPVLTLPMPDIYRALGLLDWSAPGSRELVALGNEHVAVVDPRNGAVLHSQPFAPGGIGRIIPRVLDWDADGDQDMIWFDSGSLRLLRNPEGAEVLQSSHGESHVLGYVRIQDEPQLVVVIESGEELLFRRLDPQTLALRTEIIAANTPFPSPGNVRAPRFILGDFHPARGPEILRISGALLRALTLDGRQLWERPVGHGEYFDVQLAEGECVGSVCPPLAVREFSASGQTSHLSVLNGADGSSTWDSLPSTEGLALHALTDVSGDNLPELIVVTGPTSTQRLRALDARNGQLRWEVPLGHSQFVKAVRRSGDRLVVLFGDTTMALFGTDGTPLGRRRLQANGQCEYTCRLSYLSRPFAPGDWIISADHPNYIAVREDLVGEVTAVQSDFGFRSLQVASPTLLNGVSNFRVVAWALDDRLFGGGFED